MANAPCGVTMLELLIVLSIMAFVGGDRAADARRWGVDVRAEERGARSGRGFRYRARTGDRAARRSVLVIDIDARTFVVPPDPRVHRLPEQIDVKLFTAQSDSSARKSARFVSTPRADPTAAASRWPRARANSTSTWTGLPVASRYLNEPEWKWLTRPSLAPAPLPGREGFRSCSLLPREVRRARARRVRDVREQPRTRASGFSLLEVLAAFVILALVGTALFRLFSGALGNVVACRRV